MSAQTNNLTYAVFKTPFSKAIISDLESRKQRIIFFPEVETEKTPILPDPADSEDFPLGFDWLIFSDLLAVDYFVEILTDANFDLFELDAVQICALGQIVADRLRFVQIHADLIPAKNDASTVFKTIREYLAKNLGAQRFLIVRSAEPETPITAKLSEAGAEVEELLIYQAISPTAADIPRLKSLLRGGAVDIFIFSSPRDILSLSLLFPKDNLIDLLRESKIAAVDSLTFQNLTENGFKPIFYSNLIYGN